MMHALRRLGDFLTSETYRRVLWSRLYCFVLGRLNPSIAYLGIVKGDETIFLFLRDNVITPYTLAQDHFQREDLERVLALSQDLGVPSGGLFLDVGANIGTTTLYALRSGRFSKALCIEPAPSNLKLLRLNMNANGLSEKVRIAPLAVSNKRGTMKLGLCKDNSGDHRIAQASGHQERETVAIEVETLDQILLNEGFAAASVSLVWMDTQGHEGFILSGAQRLLKQRVPFCIEFWPHGLKEAGGYEILLEIIEREFAWFIDLGAKTNEKQPTAQIRAFARRFEGSVAHTDLFLAPRK